MAHFESVTVRVDTPAGGLVKRRDDGSIDYVSIVPCPFNYGSVPAVISGDGDALDAVLLGPRLQRGTLREARVWGIIDFTDAGLPDPKLVCGSHPPTRWERRRVLGFFAIYAWLKGPVNRLRGQPGRTASAGWLEPADWTWETATAGRTPGSR